MECKTLITFNVAGTTFTSDCIIAGEKFINRKRQTILSEIAEHIEELQESNVNFIIQKEPDNEYDPLALVVKIYTDTQNTEAIVGYVPVDVRKTITTEMFDCLDGVTGKMVISDEIEDFNNINRLIKTTIYRYGGLLQINILTLKIILPIEFKDEWQYLGTDAYNLRIEKCE